MSTLLVVYFWSVAVAYLAYLSGRRHGFADGFDQGRLTGKLELIFEQAAKQFEAAGAAEEANGSGEVAEKNRGFKTGESNG